MKIKEITLDHAMNKQKSKNKSVKVLLPGIQAKVLKPVAALVDPQNLVVPLVLTSTIAQVGDNLTGVKTPKEVQQMESIKTYNKSLGVGPSRQLSAIHALGSTLGPEASTLATLPPEERLTYLEGKLKDINTIPGPAKVMNSAVVFNNPEDLATHRRGLALQCRSNMQSMPLYSKQSITIGMPIRDINLDIVIASASQLWENIGRDPTEFDTLLLQKVPEAKTVTDAVIRIVSDILKPYLPSGEDGILEHRLDTFILKGEDNLVPVERGLGIIARKAITLPDPVEISSKTKVDPLLQAALDQQKQAATAVSTGLQKVGKTAKHSKAGTKGKKPSKAAPVAPQQYLEPPLQPSVRRRKKTQN